MVMLMVMLMNSDYVVDGDVEYLDDVGVDVSWAGDDAGCDDDGKDHGMSDDNGDSGGNDVMGGVNGDNVEGVVNNESRGIDGDIHW